MATPIAPARSWKVCTECKVRLPLHAFGRNRQSSDGLHYYCRTCAAKRQQRWAKKNPDKVKEMQQRYLARMHARNAERDPYA
jgi:hypothetical protein